MTIGTSLVTYNCLSQDYCLEECIASVLPFSDEVVITDVLSDDGTWGWLNDTYKNVKQVKLVSVNQPKDSYNDFEGWRDGRNWLARSANRGRLGLGTDWHFLIQADEVIHEQDHAKIRAWAGQGRNLRFPILEFWQNHRQTLAVKEAARFGLREIPVFADGGVLDYHHYPNWAFTAEAQIYHYGYIRDFDKWKSKACQLQKSLHGSFDEAVWQSAESVYKSRLAIPFTGTHPAVIQSWLKRHNFT